MKIMNLQEFLKLPTGVLFSKFEPNVFDGLEIKEESIKDIDFYSIQIAQALQACSSDEWQEAIENGINNKASIKIDLYMSGRDGCFQQDQLFAVWEPKDVDELIARLSSLKKWC